MDVLLYVDIGGQSVHNVEKDITQKVSNILVRVKRQHDFVGKKTEKIRKTNFLKKKSFKFSEWSGEKTKEWQAFLDMCGVPWIGFVGTWECGNP